MLGFCCVFSAHKLFLKKTIVGWQSRGDYDYVQYSLCVSRSDMRVTLWWFYGVWLMLKEVCLWSIARPTTLYITLERCVSFNLLCESPAQNHSLALLAAASDGISHHHRILVEVVKEKHTPMKKRDFTRDETICVIPYAPQQLRTGQPLSSISTYDGIHTHTHTSSCIFIQSDEPYK